MSKSQREQATKNWGELPDFSDNLQFRLTKLTGSPLSNAHCLNTAQCSENELVEDCSRDARDILQRHWADLERIAHKLLDEKELSADQVRAQVQTCHIN